jgi:hypothetical protein
MTVHLVTVGDSVRRFILDPGPRHQPPHQPPPGLVHRGKHRDAERLSVNGHPALDLKKPDSLAEWLHRLAAGDADTVARATEAIDEAGVASWGWRASAEATTLHTVTVQAAIAGTGVVAGPGHGLIGGQDLVVLLASDTGAGLLAAFWNAALLRDGDLGQFAYLDDPAGDVISLSGPARGLPGRGGVLVARIRNLDLSAGKDYRPAMRHLGILGRRVLEGLDDGEDIQVHLSGGYKATIPFMIGIAEGLRSVKLSGRSAAAGVRAFVVHEDPFTADPATAPQLIELPLRYLNSGILDDELDRITGTAPPGEHLGALEGYAYLRVGDRFERTPFGEGLIELMGRAQKATG